MKVEDSDVGYIDVGAVPSMDQSSYRHPIDEASFSLYPDYSPELAFGSIFSDLDTLGGNWDSDGDSLIELSLDPKEVKASAANLKWLAHLEDMSLEEMAPVADIYQTAYNKKWFGGKADTPVKFFDAVGEYLHQVDSQEAELDEEFVEEKVRAEHPELMSIGDYLWNLAETTASLVHHSYGKPIDSIRRAVRGAAGSLLAPSMQLYGYDAPLTKAESAQEYLESFGRLRDLSSDSLNPIRPYVEDSGELNPEALGARGTQFLIGKAMGSYGRSLRAGNINRAADGRVSLVQERLKTEHGIIYDRETKSFYDGKTRIPDESVSEIVRQRAATQAANSWRPPPSPPESAPPLPTELKLVEDLKVDGYDFTTKKFRDRGYIIDEKDIEAYLAERKKLDQSKVAANISPGKGGNNTPVAKPTGKYYSVMFQMKLDAVDIGTSDSVHFHRANAALEKALKSNPQFAAEMEKLSPGIMERISSKKGRKTPHNFVWHHDRELGILQLAFKWQHKPGSIFWRTFHPDPGAVGGYYIWALPAGAKKRK